MSKNIFPGLALFTALALFACEGKKTPPPPSPLVTINMTEKKNRKCLRDSVCAEIRLHYPILTGGDNTAAVNAINDSLLQMALAGLETNPIWTAEQGFDSARISLYTLLQEQIARSVEWKGYFYKELKTNTLFNTPKYLSVEMTALGYTGGAHPSYNAVLATYDLNTGKSVELTHIVSDTTALRPLLENGFLAAKKTGMSDTTKLSDLLLPGIAQLPVSTNTCIMPEGVRFLYNPYEVAPWAVGATEITLTWEQLGRLADRKKWLE